VTGPGAPDELIRAFEAQRPRLLRVAYASLGSVSEAEDCVQEAWLRLRRMPDPGSIRDLGAWLTTTVSRLACDALGSARPRSPRRAAAATWRGWSRWPASPSRADPGAQCAGAGLPTVSSAPRSVQKQSRPVMPAAAGIGSG